MSHIDLSEHPAYRAMLRMDGEAAKAVAAAASTRCWPSW